jgi:DNA replication protein DnaC
MVEAMRHALVGWSEVVCARCGVEFRTKDVERGMCPPCEEAEKAATRLEREARQVLETCESWVPAWCLHAGMAPREATAEWEKVPASVRRAMTRAEGIDAMLRGERPRGGFGLVGATGTGKTFALAALLKRHAVARWKMRAPVMGLACKKQFARWVRWPEVAAEFRFMATREKGHDAVGGMVDEWSGIDMLVLDDIGAERVRGDYASDWTTSLLDVVVDRRYNLMQPTWWTTNLSPEEFVGRYGSRLWSRLTGSNPAVLVANGPDLRVQSEGSRG